MMVCLPEINRALWHSVRQQAHGAGAALAAHDFALAAAGAISIFLVALSIAGSLFVTVGLGRRLAAAGLRWSAGRPGRRVIAAAIALTVLGGLATLWITQGQFNGW